MMTGSAIRPAFDYLLANLPGVLTPIDPTVQTVDGWVTEATSNLFVVGRQRPDTESAATGATDYMVLGGGRVNETFDIPCYIDCFAGGDNQAEARNPALALLDAFIKFMTSDLTLGGALHGGYARLSVITVDGTADVQEAAEGRRCVISFSIACTNIYTPS